MTTNRKTPHQRISTQSQEPEMARDEPSSYGRMTSHISPEYDLNPNVPTFVGQSANNYVLHSSPGLITNRHTEDMITNRVSELNISNDYFILQHLFLSHLQN